MSEIIKKNFIGLSSENQKIFTDVILPQIKEDFSPINVSNIRSKHINMSTIINNTIMLYINPNIFGIQINEKLKVVNNLCDKLKSTLNEHLIESLASDINKVNLNK